MKVIGTKPPPKASTAKRADSWSTIRRDVGAAAALDLELVAELDRSGEARRDQQSDRSRDRVDEQPVSRRAHEHEQRPSEPVSAATAL